MNSIAPTQKIVQDSAIWAQSTMGLGEEETAASPIGTGPCISIYHLSYRERTATG